MIRIKICGIRSPKEAIALAEVGVNAIGVIVGVVARSEHAVSIGDAARIFRGVAEISSPVACPPERVLVTHATDPETLLDYVQECDSQVEELQLHGPMANEQFGDVCRRFVRDGPRIDLVRVIHIPSAPDIPEIRARVEGSAGAAAILLDTVTRDRLGGTGLTHDWAVSAEIRRMSPLPVILAGGVTPENVEEAIRVVRPAGIDVNTGTRDLGRRYLTQSVARVGLLIQAVRRAEAQLDPDNVHGDRDRDP